MLLLDDNKHRAPETLEPDYVNPCNTAGTPLLHLAFFPPQPHLLAYGILVP